MAKRKIRGIQISAGHSIHYFQVSDGEVSMTVDCIHGNCIITEKELLSYLQSRNSLNECNLYLANHDHCIICHRADDCWHVRKLKAEFLKEIEHDRNRIEQ